MILAEMFAVQNGFGYVLWRGYEFMRMDIVIAGMMMLGISVSSATGLLS